MFNIDLTRSPQTDPLPLYRYRDAIYSTDLLAAALVHLDFFTWLNQAPATLQRICETLQIHHRPADVMLTLFTAMGLVSRAEDTFELTLLAKEHLVKDSPWFIGPYYASMKDRPVILDYLKVLRTDRPSNWSSLEDQQAWAKAMEDDGFAKQFTAAMDCRGVYLGQALAKAADLRNRRHLLDVAGGSGIYACALAAANSELTATVFEKPPVDSIACQAIGSRGYQDRVSVRAGDMFANPWPAGSDVHLLSNVLHDWDVPRVKQLLQRSFESLGPGGILLIHDMHLNGDKTGPLPVAQYSALLMNITEGKCYSVNEMSAYTAEAGFQPPEFHPTAADRSVLICRKG